MFFGRLDDGLGDEDVQAGLGGGVSHLEVKIVGREDEDGVAGRKFFYGGTPGLWGSLIVVGEAVE